MKFARPDSLSIVPNQTPDGLEGPGMLERFKRAGTTLVGRVAIGLAMTAGVALGLGFDTSKAAAQTVELDDKLIPVSDSKFGEETANVYKQYVKDGPYSDHLIVMTFTENTARIQDYDSNGTQTLFVVKHHGRGISHGNAMGARLGSLAEAEVYVGGTRVNNVGNHGTIYPGSSDAFSQGFNGLYALLRAAVNNKSADVESVFPVERVREGTKELVYYLPTPGLPPKADYGSCDGGAERSLTEGSAIKIKGEGFASDQKIFMNAQSLLDGNTGGGLTKIIETVALDNGKELHLEIPVSANTSPYEVKTFLANEIYNARGSDAEVVEVQRETMLGLHNMSQTQQNQIVNNKWYVDASLVLKDYSVVKGFNPADAYRLPVRTPATDARVTPSVPKGEKLTD